MEVAQEEKTKKVGAQLGRGSSCKRFTWAIDNFSRLNVKKLSSDVFCVGGYKWKILVFPKGNVVDYLSVYLAVADSGNLPRGWKRYAQFTISVINQINSISSITKESEHEFNAHEDDWGFTSMCHLSELTEPSEGYLVNDRCIIEAEVRLKKEQDEKKLEKEEKRDSVDAQQDPICDGLQPTKPQLAPKPIDSHTVITDVHVIELPPTQGNLPQEQTTQKAVPLNISREQPEKVNLVAKTNTCHQGITPVTFSSESSQHNEQVTLVAKDVQKETKTISIPSSPFIVDPSSVQPPQEPTVVESDISSSYLFELDTLFSDIQNLLIGKSFKLKTPSSFCPHACSKEELAQAKKVFKECLSMKLSNVIQLGRDLELKNSLSTMLSGNVCPDNLVNFTTEFLANFEKYAGAQRDLREAQEKEKSIGELKTTIKQLVSEFMPLRNRAESVDEEIVELERQLTEKNAEKAWVRKSLEDLTVRATTSKQELIDAQEVMRLLTVKKEQAEKIDSEMESLWELLNSSIP